jgi:RNA polymerase sigma factor (sigma-70 family)
VQVAQSDAQLVARCRQGEDEAWRELVERFSRYVYAIAVQAYRLPPADAEDVFQEVFARAYENLHKLRDDNAIRPWLAQLTRRLCLDSIRASARVQPEESLELEGADDTIAKLDEPPCPTTAARSSTASSLATRATAISAMRSISPPARSRAASRAAS